MLYDLELSFRNQDAKIVCDVEPYTPWTFDTPPSPASVDIYSIDLEDGTKVDLGDMSQDEYDELEEQILEHVAGLQLG